ncbi:MAG: hypothetical protein ACKOVA_01095 [Novosphingobium sp.]
MVPHAEEPSLASRLCLACAMCCDGTIFDVAVMREGDAEAAKACGFQTTVADDGREAFKLPCHHLSGTACTRYDLWRPSTCGKFQCTTQKRALDDDIAEDEALAHITSALQARDAVLALLPSGETLSDARTRFQDLAASSSTLAPQDARLVVRMFAFERLLDQHFRKPGKGRLPGGQSLNA